MSCVGGWWLLLGPVVTISGFGITRNDLHYL